MSPLPRVLFWPLGKPDLETAQDDAKQALENLKQSDLDITSIEEMTWWEPTEIPRLARSVKKKDFDLVVIFSATHGTVKCITAVAQTFKIPSVIWAIPLRYSLATSGLASSYLSERGYYVRLLCNSPNDDSVRPKIETIAKAARAYSQSKQYRIGIVGSLSPLMISLPYNLPLLKKKLGPKIIEIKMASLGRALNSIKKKEIETAASEIGARYPVKVNAEILEKAVRFQLGVRKIVKTM